MSEQLKLKIGFHYGDAAKSPTMLRTLRFMEGGHWYSTREIIEGAHVCAVNSIMSALDKNGVQYECKYWDRTESDGRIFKYRILSIPGHLQSILDRGETGGVCRVPCMRDVQTGEALAI